MKVGDVRVGKPHLVVDTTPERGEKVGCFAARDARTVREIQGQSFWVSVGHAWDGATVVGPDVAAQVYAWVGSGRRVGM